MPCCCSCGHSSPSIRCCMVLKYLMQGVCPCCTHSIVCCIFLRWHWSWWSCGRWSGQCHSTPIYQLCVIMYSIVLCHCYRISVWCCRQRVNPTLLTCVLICSNVGICYCLLTGVKWHHSTDWFSTNKRMYCCWNMEAAQQIYLYFAHIVKSFDIVLWWNSKDYWCRKEVHARNVSGKEAVCPGLWRMSSFRVTSLAIWVLNCGPSIRSACIEGVLLQKLLTVCWDTSSILVEQRDLRHNLLGRAAH